MDNREGAARPARRDRVALVLLALLRPGEPPSWELRRLRTAFRVVAFFILCENLRSFGILAWPQFAEGLGLLVFIGGLGSIAARQFFAGRSRLAALRQELDTARLIQSMGPILGRLARRDYVESCTSLEAGDRLLVFSDGIPEAASPSGEPFGDDRLQAFLAEHGHLSPDAFAGALLSRLETWSQPRPPAASPDEGTQGFADDLTLVVLVIASPTAS